GESNKVDLDNIKVEKKAGGSIRSTSLIKGIVLDKEVVHSGMPTKIEKAKIALVNSALEIEKTEMSAEIRITDPTQMQMFLEEERKVETDKWVFIEGCKNPRAITLLLRGGSQRVVDEVDRSMHDALMVVKDVIENPAIVAGGGAPEEFLAFHLKDWADRFEGR